MADRELLIPEIINPERRMGRHVRHDPRSVAYRMARTAQPKSVEHKRALPVLNQGNLGTCVPNTGVGILGTEPFWSTLTATEQKMLTQAYAVDLYREITTIDDFPGQYEPDDTGTDGLSLGKILVKRGFISGYRHAMSIGEAHAAIQEVPLAVGTMWFSSMEYPDKNGVVEAIGKPAGGHEYECFKYDLAADLWWFYNSWTDKWGKRGTFAMSTPTFTRLLAMQGDITVLIPRTKPKPEPVGPVSPIVVSPIVPMDFPTADFTSWDKNPYSIPKRDKARKSIRAWIASQNGN